MRVRVVRLAGSRSAASPCRGAPREILVAKTFTDFALPARRRIRHICHRRTIRRDLKRESRLHALADELSTAHGT